MARCQNCGLRLSRSAERCPRCGLDAPITLKVPAPSGSTPLGVGVLVIVIVAIAALYNAGRTAPPDAGMQIVGEQAADQSNIAIEKFKEAYAARPWRPRDQIGDPYADTQDAIAAARQANLKQNYWNFITMARAGFDCRVFAPWANVPGYGGNGDGFLWFLAAKMARYLNQPAMTIEQLQQAERYGAELAAKSNGCEYFHEHPEAVQMLRQIVNMP